MLFRSGAATRVTALILAAQRRRKATRAAAAATNLGPLHAANHALARRAACESAVLLKNEPAVLPLAAGAGSETTIAVVGGFATCPRYQGAGSSHVNPHTLDVPLQAIRDAAPAGTEVVFVPGYDAARCRSDARAADAAVTAAQRADTVVLLAGLPSADEAEAIDRSHARLPAQMRG